MLSQLSKQCINSWIPIDRNQLKWYCNSSTMIVQILSCILSFWGLGKQSNPWDQPCIKIYGCMQELILIIFGYMNHLDLLVGLEADMHFYHCDILVFLSVISRSQRKCYFTPTLPYPSAKGCSCALTIL